MTRFEDLATPADWANHATMLQASGHHHVPLYQAAAESRITLVCTTTRACRATLPGWSTKPAVVLIADDDGQSTGPAGWRCRDALARWARSAIVHGTGGFEWHYETAIEVAESARRVLVVDTNSAHVGAWAALLASKPTVVLVPPSGLVHPAPPPSRATH